MITKIPYTHLPGTAMEKQSDGNDKFMTLNACMLWGGLPIPLGGMRPPRARMEKLAEKIRAEDPDVVVMQELAFDPAHQLYGKIKDRYAHFFTRIGPNPPLMESGLFVASKYPVLGAGFIPFPGQFGIKRGAFWIETPKCFVFTTHLEFGHGRDGAAKRKEQTDLIWEKIKTFREKKPCFLLGDLNMDESHYQELGLGEKFQNPYLDKHPTIDEKTATCTNVINAHICGDPPPAKPFELDDYALLAKGPHDRFGLETTLLEMYDNNLPDEALSDHRGLILTARSARLSIFG
jgi:endonuclease/exonuclease/phosphatase family metal-dependent hydrolase